MKFPFLYALIFLTSLKIVIKMEFFSPLNILFIINPVFGGKNRIDWEAEIRNYFKQLSYHFDFFGLTGKDDFAAIK